MARDMPPRVIAPPTVIAQRVRCALPIDEAPPHEGHRHPVKRTGPLALPLSILCARSLPGWVCAVRAQSRQRVFSTSLSACVMPPLVAAAHTVRGRWGRHSLRLHFGSPAFRFAGMSAVVRAGGNRGRIPSMVQLMKPAARPIERRNSGVDRRSAQRENGNHKHVPPDGPPAPAPDTAPRLRDANDATSSSGDMRGRCALAVARCITGHLCFR